MTRIIFKFIATAAFVVSQLGAGPAVAQSVDDQARAEFARVVYRHWAAKVHNDRPQALLRAVVVLRVKLNDQGQWQAEVFRDNPQQPEMTKVALETVTRLPPPVGLTAMARELLLSQGLLETWLFQNDGRFALKTLAKPQRGV